MAIFRSSKNGCCHAHTYSRHSVAARDYLKIPRASTDVTGASLTALTSKVGELVNLDFLLVVVGCGNLNFFMFCRKLGGGGLIVLSEVQSYWQFNSQLR